MYKIKILTVGKTKEMWLEEGIKEYIKRLTSQAEIDLMLAKNDLQLTTWIEKESHVICLDAHGKLMDSQSFSNLLLTELEKGGARLTFVIGGAEGIPEALKRQYPLVSLSLMTFTHQLARLILVEQIYRAFEIAKGSKYHK
jgi:23S rRNA (pseudouridine1915-N3)-methyltransferase